MAKKKAVIVVPSQGDDTVAFVNSAKYLAPRLYHEWTVVRTTVRERDDGYVVTFSKNGSGAAFSWANVNGLASVLTISHGGSYDGPNLAAGAGGYQPWSFDEYPEAAHAFWSSVGSALGETGKVILVGCHMGDRDYAKNVAVSASRTVYAAKGQLAAGNSHEAHRVTKWCEANVATPPMQKFRST